MTDDQVFQEAANTVYQGYACPRDSYDHDDAYIIFLRQKLTKAHTLMQELKRIRAKQLQVADVPERVLTDVELDEFARLHWSWSVRNGDLITRFDHRAYARDVERKLQLVKPPSSSTAV